MNKELSEPENSTFLNSSVAIEGLLPIARLLYIAQGNEASNLKDTQAFETLNFQLGDEIPVHPSTISSSEKAAVHSEQNAPYFYLICQGRVRLLCRLEELQPVQSREVSVLLLETNETFGADFLFNKTPLPYRAIAASSVQVARIPAANLLPLLEEYPQLRTYLFNQALQRERLIFLKSLTSLRSLSSHCLKQLTVHWLETTLTAGTALTEENAIASRFWLREGEIYSPSAGILPGIGDGWGYPASVPNDWFAKTDIRIYKLPAEHWDAIRPLLRQKSIPADAVDSESFTAIASGQSETIVGGLLQARTVAPSHPSRRAIALPSGSEIAVTSSDSKSDSNVQSIAFPKPTQRRFLDWLDRYPWVEQQSSSDCGAACLAMISRYWGKHFPIYVLREQCNVNRSGASLKSLAKAAENLGFHARPVRASFNRMAEQPYPWIAHWEGTHYIVVYKVQSKRVIIADPALGRRALSSQEFQKHWTGYALLVTPTERLHDTEVKQASLGRYIKALIPYRSIALQIILLSVLIQVFGLVTPLFTQIILDKVVTQKSLPMLNAFVVGLLIFSVWGIALSSVRQYLLVYFSNHLDVTLIGGFINHALSLPLKFFESRRVGDIITRIQENRKIQRFLIQQVVLAWLSFLTGFVYLGLMFYYNRQLTLMVLLLIPPIVLLTLSSTPFLRQISREVFKEAADQNSLLVEMFTGVATIKSTATDKDIRWRWEDQLTRLINVSFRGRRFAIGLQAANGTINSLGSTLLLWYGATLVIQDQLTIGQFVAFNMMIGFVISPILGLANLWDQLQEILISVERLNDVFETEPEETSQQLLLTLPPVKGAVTFENVTFRYNDEEERNTLQNLSFQVKPGQTIAIIGRSGSGKTTLAKLLQGLYYPNQGLITIDGHDIHHVSLQSLRSQLGVVPQECFLFSGTILENITLFRSEFTLEQAVEVARMAEAHGFIQTLPLGYGTKVGERGSSLSGGQRQRIAIARALLGEPRILILDEATSSLDTESERRFQRNLAQMRRDRTTFIIAHRLSTVRSANNILVLDRGVLVEQGTHEELMKTQGLYYHLAQQQLDL
jgi:ATP-binding cassette, subfamily B, bacterial HlyB/CyaB